MGQAPISAGPLEATVRGWQPIETAPTDGTKIITVEKGIFSIVFFGEDWSGRRDWCYQTPDGKIFIYVHGGFNPSHWMPLPDAPNARANARP
jgi:hypothetical protein